MIGKPDLTPTPLDRITRITTAMRASTDSRRRHRWGYGIADSARVVQARGVGTARSCASTHRFAWWIVCAKRDRRELE
jgi:hypothetical protein